MSDSKNKPAADAAPAEEASTQPNVYEAWWDAGPRRVARYRATGMKYADADTVVLFNQKPGSRTQVPVATLRNTIAVFDVDSEVGTA